MENEIQELEKNTEKAAEFFEEILAYTLGPVELKELSESNKVKVVDARRKSDYDVGHIPGAINMELNNIETEHDKLSKDEITVVYCYNQQCHLGARACAKIAKLGYPVKLLEGGFKTWTEDFHYAVSTPIE